VVSEEQGGDSGHIRGVPGGTADGEHGGYGERSRGSRPCTADERRWNSGRLADGDSPELVIFPRARGG
jgi:hypothetical protein